MCPVQKFQIRNYKPDWMSNELIEWARDRVYYYCKAKREGDEDSWNIAKHLRNVVNAGVRQAKREFILDQLNDNKGNYKKFWKIIREVIPTGEGNSKQDILLNDGTHKLQREKVAEFINDYFINVGNPSSSPLGDPNDTPESPNDPSDLGVPFDPVLQAEILKLVKSINISKSSGLNNVSSLMVKEAFTVLLPQVTHMFNLSLSTSIFPKEWKKALVVHIPKAGDATKVKNYRPISLLPLPGKMLEKLVHRQLSQHFETNSLLSKWQHGFREGHSTMHSVAQLTSYYQKNGFGTASTSCVH